MYVARMMERSKFLREKLPTPAVGDAPHQPQVSLALASLRAIQLTAAL